MKELLTRLTGITLGLTLVSSALSDTTTTEAAEKQRRSDGPVYELRIYTTAKGRLPALHKRFRDHTMALFKQHGMTNVIYTTPVDKKNTLVYLLKHDSVEARNKSFAAFRDDPTWKAVFKESRKDGKIVIDVDSTLLKPTDYSPPKFSKAKKGWVYELRTYTTHKGRLPALQKRFRDHTMKLFKKHGIHNVLYTTPLDDQRKDNTLIYLIAHKSRKSARKSWKAFGADPEWKRVRKESVADGPILIKGGVKRMFLKPTDYSPVK